MAKKNTGGRGLNLKAKLDINEAKRNGQDLLKTLKELSIASSKSFTGTGTSNSKAFDVKPLNDYQAGLLKIKQEALDLAKQNAANAEMRRAQAAADKTASLAIQAALKEETRIKKEQIAAEKALQAERSKKKFSTPRDFKVEVEANTKLENSNARMLSSVNALTVANAKQNTEAAKLALVNGTLIDSNSKLVGSTQAELDAKKKVVEVTKLSSAARKQLAIDLEAEKLRQAENTKELKNNAREQLNAKGSLEQRRAALIRLTTVYDRLSKAERESAAGKRLEGILKGLVGQISDLEKATGRAQRGVGGYAEGIAEFFKKIGHNILSVLGPMALLMAAIATAKELFSHNVEISDNFVDVQRTAKLSAEEVDRLGESLKKINTRTSLEGLLEIGFIGGRLGVAKEDLVGFIKEVDELSVVLKKEFPGGAEAVATSLGKIISVYKITQKEGISLQDALRKTGSAFLELSHNGGAPVQYLQDFVLGTAGIAQITKLSMPTLLAYGSVLSKAGVQASTAATGVTRFLSDLATKRGKYFAIAQLADSTLTIEKFTNLINTDAKQALDLFFKGLKAGNPTSTESADRLKTLNLTAGKVKNTVIALSDAQETLAGNVTLVNKAYDEGTSSNHNFELANNSLAGSFDKLKNAFANYFTSASNGRALASLVNAFTDNRTEAEKLADAFKDNKHKAEELDNSLDPLVKKYDELKAKGKLNRDEQTELRDITAKIGDLLPDVITQYTEWGKALDINRGKIEDATTAQKALLEVQNRSAIAAAQFDFNKSADDLSRAVKNKGKKPGVGKVLYEAFFKEGGIAPDKERVKAENDAIILLQDEARKNAENLKKMGVTLTKRQQAAIDAFTTAVKVKPATIIQTDGTESEGDNVIARTTEVIKSDIKKLVEANKSLGTETALFKSNRDKIIALRKELRIANGGKDTEGISEQNKYNTAVKSRNTLQEQISALTKKGTDKQLSADEQELASVKDKYDKMRAAAIKFNNDPKNKAKGLRVDAGGLNEAESAEDTALRDKQATEKLKVTLDTQKSMYADYEEYKSKVGREEADKRYAELTEKDETYLESLKTRLDALEDPQKSKGASEVDLAANALQIGLIKEQIAAEVMLHQKKNDDIYADAYQSAMTNSQALLQIERDYQIKRTALGKDASAEQLANLQREKDQRIRNQNNANTEEKSGYADLMENLDEMTRSQAIKAFEVQKAFYTKQYKDKLITAQEYTQKINELNGQIDNLNGDNVFNKIAESIKRYKEAVKALGKDSIKTKEAQEEMFDSIGEGAEAAAVGVSGLAGIFDDLGIGGEKLQVVLKDVSGILSGAGEISKGIASGDPVAIVSGSIKLLSSAIDLFNGKDRKLNRKIADYKTQLDSLGKAYAALDRQVQNAVGNDVYSSQNDQIANLLQQQKKLTEIRDAEASKKKKDQDKINDLNNQIDDIPNKIADINASISQNLIQGTFRDLAKSLSDALTTAFQAGEDGIAAMDASFDQFIANAIKNSLNLALLEPLVAQFTKELTDYAKGNGNSVVGFDFEAWKKKLDEAGKQFNAGLEASKEFFPKTDQDKESSGTLSGGVQVITQTQADVLSGNIVGLRLTQMETNTILRPIGKTMGDIFLMAKANFDVNIEIRDSNKAIQNNTNRLENMENALVSINKKMDNNNSYLTGTGR